jgi:tryptophan-rich sensory protein
LYGNTVCSIKKSRPEFSPFGLQLGLNTLWSLLFFGLKSPYYAFLEILILWAAILLTIMQFRKVSKSASFLLIPYILWVSFAALLNYQIWVLNP